jgi:RNA polymerase sigma factor (sigma-70 family)
MTQASRRKGAGSARRAARSGDTARPTLEQQLRRHRNLIYSVLRRLGCGGDEDLVQVATLGLLKAADRFDPSLGFRFSTYAIPTIEGEVKRYLLNPWKPISMT